MSFVTKNVTTMFLPSFPLQYQLVKYHFLSLLIIERYIYRAYCHQNIFKQLIYLLKMTVFNVVTFLVTKLDIFCEELF